MEILTGVQPNCSELVIRLGDVSKEYVMDELKNIGIELYVIKDKYAFELPEEEKIIQDAEWDDDIASWPSQIKFDDLPQEIKDAWDAIDSNDEDIYTAAQETLKKHGFHSWHDTKTLIDNINPEDPKHIGSVYVSNDPYDEGELAIWVSQSYSESQFPTIQRMSEHFGREVEGHDGGSSTYYEEWLSGDLNEEEEEDE